MVDTEEAITLLQKLERVVVKYGTNALTGRREDGVVYARRDRVDGISLQADRLYRADIEPIYVLSIGVAAGMELNGLTTRPAETTELQLLSGEGWSYAQELFRAACNPYGRGIMPFSLTHHEFNLPAFRENMVGRTNDALAKKKLVIANANDLVTSEELQPQDSEHRISDNDPLAAYLAHYTGAQMLLMVSEAGNLGSGKGESKMWAKDYAEKRGIPVWIGTHSELENIIGNAIPSNSPHYSGRAHP